MPNVLLTIHIRDLQRLLTFHFLLLETDGLPARWRAFAASSRG